MALTARTSAAEGSPDAAPDYLVFGLEDVGLPRTVLDECDLLLRIPMPGGGVQAADGGAAFADDSVG